MELDCGVCRVRPWRAADAKPIVLHANDRDVWINLRDRFPHPYTVSHAKRYIKRVATEEPPTSFAIVVAGEPVGGIGVELRGDIERCSAEIGYWLGKRFWGRGVATAALRGVTGYGFSSLGLLRLFALPFTDNAASIRVLEKVGYVREGHLRSCAIKDGRVRDMYLYALVRETV